MNEKKKLRVLPVLAFILGMVVLCVAAQVPYTIMTLNSARSEGVYATPQQGAIARANRWYCEVEKVEIEQAATNSFDGSNPHVWYVIWKVYAKNRAPCDPDNPGAPLAHGKDYESGGNFYLNTKEGWVYLSEGRFPELVGFWMKVLGLAGPGDSTHVPRN